MSKDNEPQTSGEQPISFDKSMSFEKLLGKFGQKLDKEKVKAFEQKFGAEYKKLDDAKAVVAAITKNLEKMFVEFNEGL